MKISNLLELSNLLLVEALSPNEEEELRGHLDVLRKAAAAGDKSIPADIKDMIDKYFAAGAGAGGATGAAPAAPSAGAGGTGTSGSGTTAASAAPSAGAGGTSGGSAGTTPSGTGTSGGTPSAGAGGAGNITPDPKLDPNIARMKALAGTGGTSGAGGSAGKTPSAGERAKQAGISYDPQVEKLQTILLNIDKKAGNTKYQDLLGGFGANKDGVDGRLGKYTRSAIQQYLKDNPDAANHPKLKSILDRYNISATAAQGQVEIDPQLQKVQNKLLDLDKTAGNTKYGDLMGAIGADGTMSSGTKRAIQQYLKDNPDAANHPKLKPILDQYGISATTAQAQQGGSSGFDPQVQKIQNILLSLDNTENNNKFGRLLGAAGADGYMTPETRSAIQQYLKDNPDAANHPKLKPILDRYNISAPIPMSGARMRELYRQATGVNAAVPTNSKPLPATEIYKRETGMEPLIAAPRNPNSPAEVLDRIKSKEYQDRKDREGPNPKIW